MSGVGVGKFDFADDAATIGLGLTPTDDAATERPIRTAKPPTRSASAPVVAAVTVGTGLAGAGIGGMFGGIGAALTHVTDVDAYHAPRASIGGGTIMGAVVGALVVGGIGMWTSTHLDG